LFLNKAKNMGQASWVRINPALLMAPGTGKLSVMVMATAAKKHVTIFRRSRTASGAGNPQVIAAFRDVAQSTRGDPSRISRNAKVQQAMLSKNIHPGYHTMSKAGVLSPLHGKPIVRGR
jgi:hypothetical protein